MKLSDHVEYIRQLIDNTVRNRLGRMGLTGTVLQSIELIPDHFRSERRRIETILEVLEAETGSLPDAYEKIVEEFTFTLFNRIAALKVIEAHTLHPEIITRRNQHGDRSFAHKHWLERNPDGRKEELEGILRFLEEQFIELGNEIPLFSHNHPYHLLPTPIELNTIINSFNAVEVDEQIDSDIWNSDDVLGWLYESYNNYKKTTHKESGEKTEYNKVSIQSQVYTPRWVVKFLVDNSLGKLYLEMYPQSDIKRRYKIANVPKNQTRLPKPLTEIKLIDPATGSGNFLLYGFDLFYDLYIDQIENYGADYDDNKIPELIITHNLHGIDLDDRAIQLAQLGLYIKAKRKRRNLKLDHFNVVSSDFFLPPYNLVQNIFEENGNLDSKEKDIIRDIWSDLQQAFKFGSLIRLEEKLCKRLHGLAQNGGTLFSDLETSSYELFRETFFSNLQKAIQQNAAKQGQTFLNTKTFDAITFLQLLTQKYEICVSNPPYTPSAEYGEELKDFIEHNYKNPINTYENLYSCFIQKCFEIATESGFISMITPQTFMFIDSFKNLREVLLRKTFLEIVVQYGFGGIFKESIDPCFFVLRKGSYIKDSLFLKFDTIFSNSKNQLFQDIVNNDLNKSLYPDNIFYLNQEKLFWIKDQPFIYWISDVFREKFRQGSLNKYLKVCQGLATGDNNRFLRFHWEIENNETKKWVPYAKGGTFNKWFGNLWLTVNWLENGKDIKNFKNGNGKLRSRPQNESFYFKRGITYSASGRGGYAFRMLPEGSIFDVGGSSIFLTNEYKNIHYALGLLNSKLAFYIADCLNPTANIQVGDIQRIPFIKPPQLIEDHISALANENADIKKSLNSFKIIEPNFIKGPLSTIIKGISLKDHMLDFINYENEQLLNILLNEAVINQLVFKVFELTEEDKSQVESKIGKSVGDLPVLENARKEYLDKIKLSQEIVRQHILNLESIDPPNQEVQDIKNDLDSLYQGGNDLEEFCINHRVNPINVWYWFRSSSVIPHARMEEIALEFLIEAFRTILMSDDDGIIPLVGLPGEPKLLDRFEEYCYDHGFTSAQIMQLEIFLGRPLQDFIEIHFFKNLSDHLNLFMHLPKTPFIWHLSSGQQKGFEAFIIINKWNRDSIYKLRSNYLSKRADSLNYRLQQIGESTTGQAQIEKETIRLQLQEIEMFGKKIDELIADGYDPKLDDGVGKNIAPLQRKGMLKVDVLKSTQLEKYLKADW